MMGESEDEPDVSLPSIKNETTTARSRPRTKEVYYNFTSTFPHYFIPKRPRVIKMRDLSPATKEKLSREYYEAYDPWTGIRIAATLGILISLFTLFLTYKSKYHKTRNAVIPSKKTSLYLYEEEDLDGDVGNFASSDDTGSYAYSFRYGIDDRLPGAHEYHFGVKNNYPMEDVFVKSNLVECVALTVHKSHKDSRGPKYGTIRITEDASRSLPCSPYRQKRKNKSSAQKDPSEKQDSTIVKEPYIPTPSPGNEMNDSLSDSITSFSSVDLEQGLVKTTKSSEKNIGKADAKAETKTHKKTDLPIESSPRIDEDSESPVRTNTMVVSSKRPQDYRSRSTVVTIGRRKRKS